MDIKLLHPHHLLYHELNKPQITDYPIIQLEKSECCGLCGLDTVEIVDWKTPPTFTNLNLFAEKKRFSTLCPACHFALKKYASLHKYYILVQGEGFKVIQFDDDEDKKIDFGERLIVSRFYLKDFLLNAPTDKPWVLMLQSKQNAQHNLMKAIVNYGDSDSFNVCEGGQNLNIPREGLEDLLNALEKIKLSNSLYTFLYSDKSPHPNHKEFELWQEVSPIINPHKYTHYLTFLYNKVIPKKDYMLKLLENNGK